MSTPRTSQTLETLLKVLELINALKPIADQAFNNEAERLGLSRAERKALTDKFTTETDGITKEDMSDNP